MWNKTSCCLRVLFKACTLYSYYIYCTQQVTYRAFNWWPLKFCLGSFWRKEGINREVPGLSCVLALSKGVTGWCRMCGCTGVPLNSCKFPSDRTLVSVSVIEEHCPLMKKVLESFACHFRGFTSSCGRLYARSQARSIFLSAVIANYFPITASSFLFA